MSYTPTPDFSLRGCIINTSEVIMSPLGGCFK